MKRTLYLAIAETAADQDALVSKNRVIKGHITLVGTGERDSNNAYTTSAFARAVFKDNKPMLQIMFLHFAVSPFEFEDQTFELFEGDSLIGQFRFVGPDNDGGGEFIDLLPEL